MHPHSPNPLGLKILPLTHYNQEIKSQNPAKPMIPVDQGEGDQVSGFQSFKVSSSAFLFETLKL